MACHKLTYVSPYALSARFALIPRMAAVMMPAITMRVPAAGSQLSVNVADETGLWFEPRMSMPGHWNFTVHGDLASAFLIALMFASEKSTMITRYGAYAFAMSARLSRIGAA